ncbi:unnamed protein product [Rotaria sordida]|uniref:CCHC-type domain-containing protein n=1 Tax=Rotaria sordida TaxID=392033 RepID=A0A815RU53_9BILA|nr:unnamed protein product [Rotaria sordida]CAF1482516.1 unnamed protein product [Rotaria sordida]CAF1483125.1 unnamed protein product [Rotaria sordida]CAF4043629.1 unnamed protein product [Rotaria sordida]CAF4073993.1 unnamed protein product [Rotaria sordida]
MLAEEIAQAQARAAIQAEERIARHEARSRSKSPSQLMSTDSRVDISRSTTIMEGPQYSKIIDSIPTFSGDPHENINDWLDIISLKFDIIGYDSRQKRRFIPQYLAGNALKWHLAHREELSSWNEYLNAITSAFPPLITTSRDMNLKMLRDRKQADTEPFINYYTSVVALCQKHVSDMPDDQIIDWLKAGMKVTLYEKLQGEEFPTPQALLLRAQRVELDNAVLDSRKAECSVHAPVIPVSIPAHYNHQKRWNSPTSSQRTSTPLYTSSYPPPLLAIPSPPQAPFFLNTPRFRNSFVSQSSNYNYPISSTSGPSNHPRRPVICYSCNQPGHISPHCPYHPKD